MKFKIYIPKKGFLLFLAFLLVGFYTNGQRTITGVLTDAKNGETLIGANILIEGTDTGTTTDIDGAYTLDIPEGATNLVFSYTGFTTKVITIGASNIINVQMIVGSVLEEVIIIGYGSTKKEDATGSIQVVNQKAFNKGSITSPQELLAGKIAGVNITTNSGAPGDGAVIRIRGGSSLNASNDPLIVIDGVPVDNGGISGSRNSLNLINPNDVETFTVLKDASATAIYGSRASNGVILITTKKGKLGKKVDVNYSGNISSSSIINTIDVFDANSYRALITETYGEGSTEVASLGNTDTDWQNEIYGSAFGQDHSLSLSGGVGDILPYRASFGYTDKSGVLKNDKFERSTASLNLSPGFLENKLQVNFNFKGMWSKNNFADRGAIGNAISFDPTQPIFDSESPYGGYFTYFADAMKNPNRLSPTNPMALLDMREDIGKVSRYVTNVSANYRLWFLPDLRVNLNLGYDYSKGRGTVKVPTVASFSFNPITGGGVNNKYNQTKKNELLEFYLNYVKEFGKSKLDVMGGYSWQHFFVENYSLRSDVARTPEETVERIEPREYYLLSLFGRVNYTLQDKYLFTFTLRQDGSSRFSKDNRFGLFPAAAFAYKIYDNKEGKFNKLKLRLGYGVTGQQDIGDSHQELDYYAYLPVYTLGLESAQYQFGNTYVSTFRPEEYDANIKWETTTTYNVGVDFGFFKDRVYGSAEYYIRKTKDLLNRIPVPAGTNLSNFVTTNVGNLENKGVELSLNFVPVQTKDILWEFGFNATRNENKITKLTATNDPDYQGVLVGGIAGGVGSNIQIHSVDYPAFSFFVYEQVYAENGDPIEGLYVDRNGDGVVSPDDQYRFEKAAPDYFFGFTSNLSYKNFDLAVAARANSGNYVYNNVQSNTFYNRLFLSPNVLSNSITDIDNIQFENPEYFSDHFVQNAAFFRLDHITASYRFDNVYKDKGSITISATLQNPLVITPYSGVDPELQSGIDNNIYPRTRTILLGVSANF
ncbi:SusC/RagA family TonB-linked outer membrane protein [Saprospiraceae bacterium]|nr:SusC/RagA family TonB-linked outer membrane protein [Saprospiraceae bacterium]